MAAEVVIALYRPKPGKDRELEALLARHVPALRALGLVTARPATHLRSMEDGTWLEIFEWADGGASAHRAHEEPAVREIWDAMEKVCDFVTLGSLPEAGLRFPHFRPATLPD